MSEMISKLWRRLPLIASSEQPIAPVLIPASSPQAEPLEPSSARFYNREISDLLFIQRVLEEAENEEHPLLERLRFLSISGAVLDQFYAVRVAKLKRSANKQDAFITPDGMRPVQQYKRVLEHGRALMTEQQDTWHALQVELASHDIALLQSADLTASDVEFLKYYFQSHIQPALTPCTIDEEHPFPFIPSGGVCAILEFSDRHILIPFPSALPRFIALPGGGTRFTRLDTVLFRFWPELFPHDALLSYGVFQLLRDNDLARQERSDDLRSMVESGLKLRHRANTILLTISDTMSETALAFVAGHLQLLTDQELLTLEHQRKPLSESEHVFRAVLPGLSTLQDLLTAEVVAKHGELLFEPHKPTHPEVFKDRDCFDVISEGDVLVHWPYESFDTVVDFLDRAATDQNVLAIKQTLYRTSDDSPVVSALINAARHGKAVTTVIELEARENEYSNVELAKRLEAAGVQIIYGIVGLKIHCKATLVVRREQDDTVLYSHFSSGNYHPGTAKVYTDISYFTADPVLGRDASRVFNYLTSGTLQPTEKLVVAPVMFRNRINELIDNEIANARSGKPAHICIKVNALTDPHIVERLYAASEAGVQVDLVVRRHCSLVPGVEGMSSNIRVKSMVGRYLEHSRIYLFANGGGLASDDAIVLVGSPDLMERNLDERVEILLPVVDPALRDRLVNEIMHANIRDTRQSWILKQDYVYDRHPDRAGLCAQTWFMQPEREPLGKLEATICTGN